MLYHAHIYWSNTNQRITALELREELAELGCRLGRVWDVPIGPHPLPMYQVNFNSDNAADVEALLKGLGLTVLLHEDTSDDVRDHTDGAKWIGNPLVLDIEWLKNNT